MGKSVAVGEKVKLPVILEGAKACSVCEGACCKEIPGESVPADWSNDSGEIDWDLVREALSTEEWCIDWWEGDPRFERFEDGQVYMAPYIRPRHDKSKGVRDPSWWGGTCVFLADTGCRLSPIRTSPADKVRPAGCRNLIANIKVTSAGKIHNRCFSEIGRQFKKEAAIAWLPYHERLLSIVSEIEDKGFNVIERRV